MICEGRAGYELRDIDDLLNDSVDGHDQVRDRIHRRQEGGDLLESPGGEERLCRLLAQTASMAALAHASSCE